MCLDPVSLAIIGTVAMAAGTGMQYVGQQKAEHALTQTFNTEQRRQKAFDKESQAKFEDSLQSTAGVADPTAMANATAAREKLMAAVTKSAAAPGTFMPGSGSAPAIVNTNASSQGAASDARTGNLAHALASLGGVGDLMEQNARNIGRNSQDIDQITRFKSGSLDVLGSEMEAAKHKGSTLRTLGGLAQTIGQMALSSAIPGMGAAGGLAPTEINAFSVPAMLGNGGADFSQLVGALPRMAI